MTNLFKHLTSLVTALAVIINLGFWMWFIFLFALIKLIAGPASSVADACNRILESIYRIAARFNSLWMTRVVGIRIEVNGELPQHPAPIVVVNHQTWLDIPVLHHVVTGQGPILKFLIKRQLVWLPIVGWICWALNFPRLYRGGSANARGQDYAAIKSASTTLTRERGALLIFAEGTRFTWQKHSNQNSPYQHLLTPRPGGLKIALDSVSDDTPVVDITINYNGGETNFWRCMCGANRHITVTIRCFKAGDISDARTWLNLRWAEKDSLLHGTDQTTLARSS